MYIRIYIYTYIYIYTHTLASHSTLCMSNWSLCQLEPVMWNIFVDLSGDPLAKEVQLELLAELCQLWQLGKFFEREPSIVLFILSIPD